MEKNININTYLTLRKEGLKSTRKQASEESISTFGEEDGKEDLHYPDADFEAEELYFEAGELFLNGALSGYGKEIGYLSQTIPLGNDTVIEIIEYYMKKMEKVKAVLEATK